MKGLIVSVLAFTLIGCSSTKPPELPGMVPNKPSQQFLVDSWLLEPCDNFSDIATNPTPNGVLVQHALDKKVLSKCSEKQKQLAVLLRQIQSNK